MGTQMLWYFVRMFHNYIFDTLESFYRSYTMRRIRHDSDSDLTSIDHNNIPNLIHNDDMIPKGAIERTWADSLPFEIPFGFATTFKSDEDWLDEWDELKDVKRKPYTFDDRVNDYRKGIKKALENTEKKEEKEEEVDLLFAEVIDESETMSIAKENEFSTLERFTPVCTPKKNRK